MYMTRMFLDVTKRAAMRALTNRNQLHGVIESAFAGPRQHPLWRIDTLGGKTCLLLLSEEKPDLTAAAAQFGASSMPWESKEYAPLLERAATGTQWRFRLTANPTYSTPTADGARGAVRAHTTPTNQCRWLMNQAARHGFAVQEEQFSVTKNEWLQFYKGTDDNRRVTILSVTFEGILTVTDENLFREALLGGIGRGKAYGMGLLTLVRNRG